MIYSIIIDRNLSNIKLKVIIDILGTRTYKRAKISPNESRNGKL